MMSEVIMVMMEVDEDVHKQSLLEVIEHRVDEVRSATEVDK